MHDAPCEHLTCRCPAQTLVIVCRVVIALFDKPGLSAEQPGILAVWADVAQLTDAKGTASPKSPPLLAKTLITSGVMMLDVASVISVISTSTGRSRMASARIRLTSSVRQLGSLFFRPRWHEQIHEAPWSLRRIQSRQPADSPRTSDEKQPRTGDGVRLRQHRLGAEDGALLLHSLNVSIDSPAKRGSSYTHKSVAHVFSPRLSRVSGRTSRCQRGRNSASTAVRLGAQFAVSPGTGSDVRT